MHFGIVRRFRRFALLPHFKSSSADMSDRREGLTLLQMPRQMSLLLLKTPLNLRTQTSKQPYSTSYSTSHLSLASFHCVPQLAPIAFVALCVHFSGGIRNA
jgi:hypothetical protein